MLRLWMAFLLIASTSAIAENTLTTCESQDGFKLLFDGTLAGFQQNWVNYKSGTDVNTDFDSKWTLCPDIEAVCTKATASNTLRSKEKFADFDLRLDYRDDGDAGIFYRGLTRGATLNATAVEYGVMNDPTGLAKTEWAGSVNAIFGPEPYTYKAYSTSQWNSVRIVAVGDSVEHWMNGVKVLGYRFWGAAWNAAFAKSKYAASLDKAQATAGCKCQIPSGYFGFQGDHPTTWNLRNIRVNTNASTVRFGADACAITGAREARPRSFDAPPEYRSGSLRVSGAEGSAELIALDGSLEGEVVFTSGVAPVGASLRSGLHLLRFPGARQPRVFAVP